MFLGAGAVFDIGRGDQRVVLEKFEARIPAIVRPFRVAVEQLNTILAVTPLSEAFVRTDPGDEMSMRRAVCRHITETEHQATIVRITRLVAVAGKGRGRFDGITLGSPVVFAELNQRLIPTAVLSHDAGNLIAVR